MTDDQRLTLEELASAVGMTTRNVRAYQTRGLLPPPRRAGRNSVYNTEHVERLRQVQRARARGASLQLLKTLIAEGRDLDGVWEAQTEDVVDVTDASLTHTPECSAHLDVPLEVVLTRLGEEDVDHVRRAMETLVEAGVFLRRGDEVRVPGAYGCAAGVLHDHGVLHSACEALQLTRLVTEAAGSVASAVADAVRSVDVEVRPGAALRLGELAGAVVAELVSTRLATLEGLGSR